LSGQPPFCILEVIARVDLRRKLEDDRSQPRFILTSRKAGYRLQQNRVTSNGADKWAHLRQPAAYLTTNIQVFY
jgi:DNA-binding winged helix-turn-helix (wHTH) protein